MLKAHEKREQNLEDRPDFWTHYAEFVRQHDLSELGLEDDFAESLRDQSPGRDCTNVWSR